MASNKIITQTCKCATVVIVKKGTVHHIVAQVQKLDLDVERLSNLRKGSLSCDLPA